VVACLPKIDNTNDFTESYGIDVIIQSYFIILHTPKGKRAWQPDFGCSLMEQVFSLATSDNLEFIKNDVRSALERWEPRAKVNSVDLQYFRENKTILLTINMKYDERDYEQKFMFNSELHSIEDFNIYSIRST
jgi:phage baseplate assembly protein W